MEDLDMRMRARADKVESTLFTTITAGGYEDKTGDNTKQIMRFN